MLNDIKSCKPSSKYIKKEPKEPYPKEPYNIATELNIIKVRLEELYEEDVKTLTFKDVIPKALFCIIFSLFLIVHVPT